MDPQALTHDPNDDVVCSRCRAFFSRKLPDDVIAEIESCLEKPYWMSGSSPLRKCRTEKVNIASLRAFCPICRLIYRLTERMDGSTNSSGSEFEIELRDGMWEDKRKSPLWHVRWDLYPEPKALLSRRSPYYGFKEDKIELQMSVRHGRLPGQRSTLQDVCFRGP